MQLPSGFNDELRQSLNETFYMISVSLLFAIVLGTLIGLLLFITSNNLFPKNKIINKVVGTIVNIIRSIPFIILLVLIIPISEAIVHTTIGPKAVDVIIHILIPEALPQLIKSTTVTIISLIGCSAMAGTVGGGGIGDLAIRYGYQRYNTAVMIICVVILVIMVQALQMLGDFLAEKLNRK